MNRHSVFHLATLLLTALGLVAACSNQGEGERCDQNNKNADCASGLTCQRIPGQEAALCCPPASQPAKVAACLQGQAPTVDGGPKDAPSKPADGGNQDAQDTGATEDASDDIAVDADADAVADAVDEPEADT